MANELNELNNLHEYLTTSDIDYKHIWHDVKTNVIQINEHNAIAKYASNYMAHNSIHQSLFGKCNKKNVQNKNKNDQIAWKQISEMIEQSHFIRDWKLYHIDGIIQQQIDILQALIAQHATPKNNLAKNCNVLTPGDLRINEWKRHILKLRKIRISANIGLEFPMNVLKYDRTEIDHIAKISAINGIQHLLSETNKNKPPLPPSNVSPPPLLRLRDLLPPTTKNYATPIANPQQQIIYTANQSHSEKQKQSKQIQQQPPPPQQHKPVYLPHTIKQRINTNNSLKIDVNRLVNVLSNPNNNISPVLNHIAVVLAKRSNIFHPIINNNVPQIKINRMPPIYNNNNNNMRAMINKPPHMIPSDDDSSDIEIIKVNIPNLNTNNNVNICNNIPKLKEFPVTMARVENNTPAIDLTMNSPPPTFAPTPSKKVSPPIDTHRLRQVYSDKKYWDQFHRQTEEHFEWFCNYDDISHILDQHINNKNAKILEIGCGLSSMASRMVLDNGYKDVLCLDWCESAIDKIKTILDKQYVAHSKEREIMDKCMHYTGMGCDSNLPDYRSEGGFWNDYKPFLNKLSLYDMSKTDFFNSDPLSAWGFYTHRAKLYRNAIPHSGFNVLYDLTAKKSRDYFYMTSNIDGQAIKAGFKQNKLYQTHGSLHHLQCLDFCEYGAITPFFDGYNGLQIDEETFKIKDLKLIPNCDGCDGLTRPNVSFFSDTNDTFNADRIVKQKDKFMKWLKGFMNGKNELLVLEIGCGKSVHSLRWECEYLASLDNVTFIRINPTEDLKMDKIEKSRHIILKLTAKTALNAIKEQIKRNDPKT